MKATRIITRTIIEEIEIEDKYLEYDTDGEPSLTDDGAYKYIYQCNGWEDDVEPLSIESDDTTVEIVSMEW